MQLLVHKDCKGNICMEEKQKKSNSEARLPLEP